MTEQEFRRMLATYGADLDRWPAGEQDAAAIFLQRADLLAAREAEAGLDRLLTRAAPVIAGRRVEDQLARLSERIALDIREEDEDEDGAWAPLAFLQSGTWLPQGAAYAGLFVAGCLGNLLARASLSFSPLELWMFNSTSMPFGG